jgi:hypothetical protein
MAQMITKKEVFNSVIPCAIPIERSRFHTWALVDAAHELVNPRRGNFKPELKWAFNLLWKADAVLGSKDDIMGKNDRIIAEDFGGDEKLWHVRRLLRAARDAITNGDLKKAKNCAHLAQNTLFHHAALRFAECLFGLRKPAEGISR